MTFVVHHNTHSEEGYPDHEVATQVLGPGKGFHQNITVKNAKKDIRRHDTEQKNHKGVC